MYLLQEEAVVCFTPGGGVHKQSLMTHLCHHEPAADSMWIGPAPASHVGERVRRISWSGSDVCLLDSYGAGVNVHDTHLTPHAHSGTPSGMPWLPDVVSCPCHAPLAIQTPKGMQYRHHATRKLP